MNMFSKQDKRTLQLKTLQMKLKELLMEKEIARVKGLDYEELSQMILAQEELTQMILDKEKVRQNQIEIMINFAISSLLYFFGRKMSHSIISFFIPMEYREELLGDIIENIGHMKQDKAWKIQIIGYVLLQIVVIRLVVIKEWVLSKIKPLREIEK